jgi:hypothetical protein
MCQDIDAGHHQNLSACRHSWCAIVLGRSDKPLELIEIFSLCPSFGRKFVRRSKSLQTFSCKFARTRHSKLFPWRRPKAF